MSGYIKSKKESDEEDDDLDEGEEYSKYKSSLKQDFKQICKWLWFDFDHSFLFLFLFLTTVLFRKDMEELKARNRLPASEPMSSKQADYKSKPFEVEEDDDDDEDNDIGPRFEDRDNKKVDEDEDEDEDDMIGPSVDLNEKDSDVKS